MYEVSYVFSPGPLLAEDIKKRWQEYTKKLYKKIFMTQIPMLVWPFTSGILECKVKWALGSITMNTASGGDEMQLSYFKT